MLENVEVCCENLANSCNFLKSLGWVHDPRSSSGRSLLEPVQKNRMQVPRPSLPNGSHIFQKHIFKCYSPTWNMCPSHIHMFSAIPKNGNMFPDPGRCGTWIESQQWTHQSRPFLRCSEPPTYLWPAPKYPSTIQPGLLDIFDPFM